MSFGNISALASGAEKHASMLSAMSVAYWDGLSAKMAGNWQNILVISPLYAIQNFLGRARWDAQKVRDALMQYAKKAGEPRLKEVPRSG